ncbi:hypothetical protein VPH35_023154 [Triticum aestivum]
MCGAPSSSPARVLADGGESRPESSATVRASFLPRSRSQLPARVTATTRRPRPTRQGLAQRGDLHIQSVPLRRSRGRAGMDSTGEKPLQ